ncbi:PIG-L family deacetylase [Kitasatospora indigofera]|nr:PIG-L family deacetylase [Kitasatospora indigofera]
MRVRAAGRLGLCSPKWPARPRALIVAAHPDDEVLCLGGTIAVPAAAGVRLRLVSVTNGEASHPHSGAPAARYLAAVRTRELHHAFGRLNDDLQGVGLESRRLDRPPRAGPHRKRSCGPAFSAGPVVAGPARPRSALRGAGDGRRLRGHFGG